MKSVVYYYRGKEMTNIFSELNSIYNYEKLRESMLLEMARVGFIDDEYEVYIHTDDPGNVPHFHIWDAETRGQKFHTCIRIESPEYFHHTGKEDYLNSSMRKELIKFLKSKPTKLKRYNTNWEVVVDMWNANNSKANVPDDLPMPDYTKLPREK